MGENEQKDKFSDLMAVLEAARVFAQEEVERDPRVEYEGKEIPATVAARILRVKELEDTMRHRAALEKVWERSLALSERQVKALEQIARSLATSRL